MAKLGIAVSIALALALTACGEAKQGFDDGFNTKFHQSFVSSCVKSATEAGAPQQAAASLCKCASDKIKERFSVKEKMSLKNEQIIPLVEECRASAAG
jgi:major membrane immunogen (membrane-anchored lipoprotein)